MILLVTNKRDITTDYIVRELSRREVSYYRLNTESLPNYKCYIGYEEIDDWQIGTICGHEVKSAYFRRPAPPNCSSTVDGKEREYIMSEWLAFLKSIYSRLDDKWLNSPVSIALAEDKPKQLVMAKSVGFNLPKGVISNNIEDIIKRTENKGLIIKPVRQGLIESKDEKVIFTSRIPELTYEHELAIAQVPSIYQREIHKKFDVRVTVVGRRVFPVAIWSQVTEQTMVDWRKGGKVNLRHEAIELPIDISKSCIELTEKLNLKFGAIDLICDQDGHYWFLEINPNGQWAWIENQTNLPIAEAIVDELVRSGNEL